MTNQPSKNIYIKNGHIEPLRFFRRYNDELGALIDLQVKTELRDLDDPVKQRHSLSIYLKAPINAHYTLHSKDFEIKTISPGKLKLTLITLPDSEYVNPYISWHGSGQIHANAYKSHEGILKSHRIVDNHEAVNWRDVIMAYTPILRAIVPLEGSPLEKLALGENTVLDLLASGPVSETSSTIKNIILNEASLAHKTITIDVFIHNRGLQFKDISQLPYTTDSELLWVAPPITLVNDSTPFIPAVTIFIYQPLEDSEYGDGIPPLIFNGISKTSPQNDVWIQAKYSSIKNNTLNP